MNMNYERNYMDSDDFYLDRSNEEVVFNETGLMKIWCLIKPL